LIPLLEQSLENQGIDWVRVVNQDFLKTDVPSLAQGGKLVVMGNLPYNISSQILFQLILSRPWVDKAFLMFQKELADRILAVPGNKIYSRLSAARDRYRAGSFFPEAGCGFHGVVI
jgi:16S rRNA (adenine1518-N6/adenine1519-N6)-dimethyltransferase